MEFSMAKGKICELRRFFFDADFDYDFLLTSKISQHLHIRTSQHYLRKFAAEKGVSDKSAKFAVFFR